MGALCGFGFVMIVFFRFAISLPGVGSVMGAPLVLFALQMMAGMKRPAYRVRWRWFDKPADAARKTYRARLSPALKKIEIFA